jgi:hypothetical protein
VLYFSDLIANVLGGSVGITRIQFTPKSFGVDTDDVVTLQSVDGWKSCAVQDNSERSPASSGCVSQMHVRRENVLCCNRARAPRGGTAPPGAPHPPVSAEIGPILSTVNTLVWSAAQLIHRDGLCYQLWRD